MFDYNCDVAQSYGIYKNDLELKMAEYASSINISAGFHAGDPMSIRQALLFAKEHDVCLNAHIGYPDIQGFGKRKMDLDKDELEAVVIYQISAVLAYAKTFDLALEGVRCHGALKEAINEDENTALIVAEAIKKVNPWLNLIVQKPEIKELVEKAGLKAAYEIEYNNENSLNEIMEAVQKPDTIHFHSLEDIIEASGALKPYPINYNRVQNQI